MRRSEDSNASHAHCGEPTSDFTSKTSSFKPSAEAPTGTLLCCFHFEQISKDMVERGGCGWQQERNAQILDWWWYETGLFWFIGRRFWKALRCYRYSEHFVDAWTRLRWVTYYFLCPLQLQLHFFVISLFLVTRASLVAGSHQFVGCARWDTAFVWSPIEAIRCGGRHFTSFVESTSTNEDRFRSKQDNWVPAIPFRCS